MTRVLLRHFASESTMLNLKKYSPAEIRLHSSKRDCWFSIHGKVYDVTTFLEYHPGGEDVMLQAAGGDATLAFDDVGHSSTAIGMMEAYVVGAVEGYESKDEQSEPSKKMVGRPTRLQRKQLTPSTGRVSQFLLPMLALVSAFGAWYYLNIYAKA